MAANGLGDPACVPSCVQRGAAWLTALHVTPMHQTAIKVLPMVRRRRNKEFDQRLVMEIIVGANGLVNPAGHVRRNLLNRAV